jgi:hypothetical protein
MMQMPEASVQVGCLASPPALGFACKPALHACELACCHAAAVTREGNKVLLPTQVCHARNVHGRTEEEIAAAAARWEVVPPSMPQLDAAAWLKGLGKSQVCCAPTQRRCWGERSCSS